MLLNLCITNSFSLGGYVVSAALTDNLVTGAHKLITPDRSDRYFSQMRVT